MTRCNLNLNHAAAGTSHSIPQPRPRSRRVMALAALAGATCLGGVQNPAIAALVTLETASLAGKSARLEFTLFDGDLIENNSVGIAPITTNGVLTGSDCSLSCTGGPPFTINDIGGLGQFLQDLTLGTRLSFDLSFTTNFSGTGTPDRLTLSLLDPATNFTLVDTDLDFLSDPVPVQDALLIVDHAPGTVIQIATESDPGIPVKVPEPGATALFSLGLALLGGQRIRRRASRGIP